MKIFAPNANSPLPALKKVLMVSMPTYFNPRWERLVARGRIDEVDFYKQSFIRQVLIARSFVQTSRSNPRSVDTMLHMANKFLWSNQKNLELHLLIDMVADKQVSINARQGLHSVRVIKNEGILPIDGAVFKQLEAEKFDAVLLLYPDAIGLGWTLVERRLRQLKVAHTIVLNGRQRVFALDAEAHRKLLWRRLLERSWLVETALALSMAIISIPLSIYDLTLGRWIFGQAK